MSVWERTVISLHPFLHVKVFEGSCYSSRWLWIWDIWWDLAKDLFLSTLLSPSLVWKDDHAKWGSNTIRRMETVGILLRGPACPLVINIVLPYLSENVALIDSCFPVVGEELRSC